MKKEKNNLDLNEEEEDENETDYLNFVQVGNVILQSKKLSITELKKNAIQIINDKKVKPYLRYLQRSDLLKSFGPSYCG